MGQFYDQLPDNIKVHISEIIKNSKLPPDEDTFEKMSKSWLEKKALFEEQTANLNMILIDHFEQNDPRGALLLTNSGSLISFGTLEQNTRWAEYASIAFRRDVPSISKRDQAKLARDINLQQAMEFIDGPIKSSSHILMIAVCPIEISLDEQEKRIREATVFLTNGFVKINRTIISPNEDYPDQFTMKSMIAYLAAKNDLTQKKTKQLLEDYIYLIETGMLLGSRVPIGRLGKAFLKVKPAQKARVGRNPATGEEITIAAKPEMMVPKISFGKEMKEKAEMMKIPEEK
ncbi:MAG: HU family DNA-binding protein [Spirochaetes bacterium]|nr:HU family DNA-binding protein [Spirochaetota bacterium]